MTLSYRCVRHFVITAYIVISLIDIILLGTHAFAVTARLFGGRWMARQFSVELLLNAPAFAIMNRLKLQPEGWMYVLLVLFFNTVVLGIGVIVILLVTQTIERLQRTGGSDPGIPHVGDRSR